MHNRVARPVLLAAILCLALAAPALAQRPAGRAYYLGQIGDYTIQMELSLVPDAGGSAVHGWYYYQRVGEPLDLDGFLDQEGKLVLREATGEGVITGRFDARIPWSPNAYLDRIEGVWSGGGTELPFALTRAAEYATFELNQGSIEARSSFPVLLQDRSFNDAVSGTATSGLFGFFEEGQEHGFAGEIFNGWTFDDDFRIVFLSDDLLSVSTTLWSYTGGAHGNTNHSALNLAVHDNEVYRLELADLFRQGTDYLAGLGGYVLNELRAQEAMWVVSGEVEALTSNDLAVFTLSPQGLHFAFSPYHMGPYVQGSFFVNVPFDVVAAHIDPSGPLARFLD